MLCAVAVVEICSKAPWLCSDRVAVIVEPRQDGRLLIVLDNFVTHLPLDWRFQLFVSNTTAAWVRAVPYMQHLVDVGRMHINVLTDLKAFDQHPQGYNALLMSEEFWRSLVADKVLIFQTDAVLCRGSPHKLEDFLQYDYVGAPWAGQGWVPSNPGCGNGGLSLRSRPLMLQVIAKHTPHGQEDIWFCSHL